MEKEWRREVQVSLEWWLVDKVLEVRVSYDLEKVCSPHPRTEQELDSHSHSLIALRV